MAKVLIDKLNVPAAVLARAKKVEKQIAEEREKRLRAATNSAEATAHQMLEWLAKKYVPSNSPIRA
jgi:regulator of protease activity HflC (stomatin/prohibitin superfamily)